MAKGLITARYRSAPFADASKTVHIRPAASCADIARELVGEHALFLGLRGQLRITVGGVAVPPEAWTRVRPKSAAVVEVCRMPASAGSSVMWASVGMKVVGALLLVFPPTAPFGAALIAGSVLVDVSAMFLLPPKKPKVYGPEDPTYDISGSNVSDPFGPVPTLIGKLRFPPRVAAVEFVETVGPDRYLHAIFAISDGPVTTPTVKLGETSIDKYDDVVVEFRRGYYALNDQGVADITSAFPSSPNFADTWTVEFDASRDGVDFIAGDTITFNGLADSTSSAAWDVNQAKPFTTYPSDVYDDNIGTEVTMAGGPVTRTTQVNANSVVCEFVWERGLVNFEKEPAGKRNDKSAGIKIEFRLTGTSDPWVVGVDTIAKGRNATPVWKGYKFRLPTAGTYDIRVTRTTPDDDNDRNISTYKWLVLRTLRDVSPVPALGVAMLAINIRASEQLSGAINQLFVECQSIVRAWNGSSWQWAPSANPAAALRHYLQSPHWSRAALDQDIDLTRIQDWAEYCDAQNLRCNAVFGDDTSIHDRMGQIAATGFAMFAPRDGKWSVVIDNERPAYEQMFTDRNVSKYTCEVVHPLPLHGVSVSFIDETSEYATNERVTYDDGYDENNAVYIEQVTLPGITHPNTVYKYCRRMLAERRLRREVHTWECDAEHLVLDIGAKVRFAHDVIAVGLGAARISYYTTQPSTGLVAYVTLDTEFSTSPDINYAMIARPATGDHVIIRFQESTGDVATFALSVPAAVEDLPPIGTLVVFGQSGVETIDLMIKSKTPTRDMGCRMSAVLYHDGIFSSDTENIPEWSSGSIATKTLPAPVVISIQSDTSVMILTQANVLIPVVYMRLQPVAIPNLSAIVVKRLSGTNMPWERTSIVLSNGAATITDVEDGETYDFKLWYLADGYFTSPPANVSGYTVVGRTDPPTALQNVRGQTIGGQIELRWDRPAEIDVVVGGAIQWRWSPAMSDASWASSTGMNGAEISGASTFIVLPLKPGTYLGRVVDSLGKSSDVVTWVTKQASASVWTELDVVIEEPTFPGTPDGTTVVVPVLRLQTGSVDPAPSWDAIPEFDIYGESVSVFGHYYFATGMDFGGVTHVRLTALISAVIYNTTDLWDDPSDLVDNDELVDVSSSASGDVMVEMRETDDDPTGVPTWTSWRRLDASEIEAWGVQFRAVLWTTAANTNVDVNLLEVRADVL